MDYPLFRLAWRNLWRNGRRTLITCSVIGFGLAAMVFVTGWARGINRHLVNSVTRSGLGMAQISAPGYLATGDSETYIPDYRTHLARAGSLPGVIGASPRVEGEGLLAVGGRSSYLRLVGIIPEAEARVTDWRERLVEGEFLTAPSTVLLGQGLAKTLEVELGTKLVLTVADIKSGELKYRLVRVGGLISSENQQLDKHTALMNLTELAGDMGLGPGAHKIALKLDVEPRDTPAMEAILQKLRVEGVEVHRWQEISPLLARMTDLQNFFMTIVLGVVFFLVSFGIVNTMSMALLERVREFGIMRALGETPGRLSALIFAEAWWLGVVGCSGGLTLGLTVILWFSKRGINLGGMEVMDVALKTPIYTVFVWPLILAMTGAFLILTPLASLLVAYRASRIDVASALRSE